MMLEVANLPAQGGHDSGRDFAAQFLHSRAYCCF